ncbi:hypothetical protein BUALT_Bualt04G0138600 [Buddleja alternifolia]|uniref:U1-type domain-containing protein n=1 Tax=Buddleja alternifolia TaxID=168488 RepID=A0AAV6XWS6_9LAMI|nr:hypothetical protein BUALT_Bualt04G0138600 [Buddleja alternifolia]
MSTTPYGVIADSATMDYNKWAEMQQNPNPNPNSDPSLTNYSATYYHPSHSYPYQQQYAAAIDPNTALLQPQPAPPGVDQPYVPPQVPVAATYAQPPVSFEPQQAAAAASVSYYPDPNVSWQPDPNVSWQPDPNVSWPVAVTQYGAPTYAAGVTRPNPAFRPQRSKTQIKKKVTKKKTTTKIVQSAWCEVCKVACNTKEILDQHNSGKKHKKNLEKLKVTSTSLPGPHIFATPPPNVVYPPAIVATPPANVASPPASVAIPPANVAISTAAIVATPPVSVATSSATPATLLATLSTSPATVATSSAIIAPSTPLSVATLASTDKPIIGPEKKPRKSKTSKAKNKAKNLKKRAAASFTEDLETKKRKVMEGGAPENNVRACSICNVVCNSAKVFDSHLAGQKHLAMVKKHMSMPEVSSAM